MDGDKELFYSGEKESEQSVGSIHLLKESVGGIKISDFDVSQT
jgi:hypothetical protein